MDSSSPPAVLSCLHVAAEDVQALRLTPAALEQTLPVSFMALLRGSLLGKAFLESTELCRESSMEMHRVYRFPDKTSTGECYYILPTPCGYDASARYEPDTVIVVSSRHCDDTCQCSCDSC